MPGETDWRNCSETTQKLANLRFCTLWRDKKFKDQDEIPTLHQADLWRTWEFQALLDEGLRPWGKQGSSHHWRFPLIAGFIAELKSEHPFWEIFGCLAISLKAGTESTAHGLLQWVFDGWVYNWMNTFSIPGYPRGKLQFCLAMDEVTTFLWLFSDEGSCTHSANTLNTYSAVHTARRQDGNFRGQKCSASPENSRLSLRHLGVCPHPCSWKPQGFLWGA